MKTVKKKKIKIANKSRQWRCSKENLFLEISKKFTGKHLCLSLFLNKVSGLSLHVITKETLAQVFSCEFYQFLRTSFCITLPLDASKSNNVMNWKCEDKPNPSHPDPGSKEKIKLNFYFLHLFVVPKKFLWRPYTKKFSEGYEDLIKA